MDEIRLKIFLQEYFLNQFLFHGVLKVTMVQKLKKSNSRLNHNPARSSLLSVLVKELSKCFARLFDQSFKQFNQ